MPFKCRLNATNFLFDHVSFPSSIISNTKKQPHQTAFNLDCHFFIISLPPLKQYSKRYSTSTMKRLTFITSLIFCILHSIYSFAESNIQDSTIIEIIDTIDTEDKWTKIILKSDFTWEYFDLGRPQIDDDDFDSLWLNDKIHAYKEIKLSDIPDEVDLCLADSSHSYCVPLQGPIRSGFKFRRTREHKGVDIKLSLGEPIKAAFDGKVRVVMTSRYTGGYGNLVVIRHANGLETYYGHLQKHNVKENDIVKAGEIIGFGGNTGRSTGPHLHFETRFQGQAFDPQRVFNFETGELRDSILTLKKHYFSIYSHYGMTDQESIEASKRKIHVIRSGDTLGGLAARYGTTVKKICQLNGFSSRKILRVGQRIIVR